MTDTETEHERIVHVEDFGATADDDTFDGDAIQRALAAAEDVSSPVVTFGPGVYRFDHTAGPVLPIEGMADLTIAGATDDGGEPATTLEIAIPEANDVENPEHLRVVGGDGVEIRNLVLDFDPRGGTAGEVVAVEDGAVRVEVFEGLPGFDGMKCYSANSWDLSTGTLQPVPPLTIGIGHDYLENRWRSVAGGADRRYEITDVPFVDSVAVGDGISWHCSVNSGEPNVYLENSRELTIRNVRIPNAVDQAVLAGGNRDLAFEGLTIAPDGDALAVGPRDGCLLSRTSGRLSISDCRIEGVRWDPINLRSTFCEVEAITGDDRLEYALSPGRRQPIGETGTVRFYVGQAPVERDFEATEYVGETDGRHRFAMTLADSVPDAVSEDSVFVPLTWTIDDGEIRDSVFANNCGTAILCQNENVTVRGNRFAHNTYANVAMGPVNHLAGGFARNVTIRENTFETSSWVDKHASQDGTVQTFQHYGARDRSRSGTFADAPYNEAITIRNNTFRDLDTAVSIRNAQDVTVEANTFEGVETPVTVDAGSTRSVTY
jgi:hypothetical protein